MTDDRTMAELVTAAAVIYACASATCQRGMKREARIEQAVDDALELRARLIASLETPEHESDAP